MTNELPANTLNRRGFLTVAGVAATMLPLSRAKAQSGTPTPPLKIGILGAGRIGSTVGTLWVKAGYEVMLSSRHPETLKALVEPLGPKARAGTVEEAIAFGDVVFVAIPYSALPALGREHGKALAGKVVLDACNPIANRDDAALVEEAKANGVGPTTLKYLPGAREVRAFNALGAKTMASESNRAGGLMALPIAGSDDAAVEIAARLVRDAGFEPVVVPFKDTNLFGPGGPGYTKNLGAAALREQLGLKP